MIGVSILGSTGSIGLSALDVIRRHPQKFRVIGLSANKSVEALFQQCQEFKPLYVVMRDPDAATDLQSKLQMHGLSEIKVLFGEQGLIEIAQAPEVEKVMAGIVGAAGLLSTFAAAKAGKQILLANKEALVMTGSLFMQTVEQYSATVIPVDSEHNAIFQVLPDDYRVGHRLASLNKIILTASGGAFRDCALKDLANVTPEQACQHPNWKMGPKITVDSATMMNKGLEVIEAHLLFGMPIENIEVILHPQSIVHSILEFADSSYLAQLGPPDMRVPISYSLGWPQRINSGAKKLNFLELAKLDFLPLSLERYPCLGLAYDALKKGGTAPTILNAANEIAVEAFLKNQIRFTEIPHIVENVLADSSFNEIKDIDIAIRADHQAREKAWELCNRITSVLS